MPYASNGELPPQVRGALDPADQDVWREAFNRALEDGQDERSAFRTAWHVAARGENVRAVSGIVSRDVVDKEGDRVNQDALAEAINHAVWNSGSTYNDVHSNHPFGDWYDAAVEVGPDGIKQTRVHGVVRRGQPFYDACWQEYILGGGKPELSIAIMKIDPYTKCDGGMCWKQVDGLQVFEASAVPRGACPGARLTSANFSAKSDTDAIAPARAGRENMEMDKEAEKPALAANKEEPQGEPEGVAPDAGSLGAVAEAIQQLIAMQSELNARMDRMEASIAALTPSQKGAEQTTESTAPEPEQEPTDKCNDRKDLVEANKAARREAEKYGASANRPPMPLDGNPAKTQQVRAESMEEKMRRYAGMSAAELEAEGQQMMSTMSRTV